MRWIVIVVAGAILASAASPASAAHQVFYFPTPQWSPSLGTEITTYDDQDSLVSPTATAPGATATSQSLEGASASAGVVTLATPYPALSASASATLSGNTAETSNAGAAATLIYSFEIAGPDGNVPTTISATGSTSYGAAGGAGSEGIAILSIASTSGLLVSDTACAGNDPMTCPPAEGSTIALNQSFSLVANQYYSVYLSIAADADVYQSNAYTGSQASASAYIDPYIVIDPGYTADYSLSVTPGIGNAAAAPEPPAWSLVILGFGAIGAAMRRRTALIRVGAIDVPLRSPAVTEATDIRRPRRL